MPDWVDSEQQTLLDLLDRRLSADPDGPFIDCCGTLYTAARLDREANRVASALADLGVRHGSTVATLLENGPAAVLAWFATHKLGAIAVPVNTALKGQLLRHQLSDADTAVIIAQEDLADRPAEILDTLDSVRHLVVVGDPAPVSGTRGVPAAVHAWSDSADRRRRQARGDGPAGRSRHDRLHRRHDRPVQGLRAEPQLPSVDRAPDHLVLAADPRGRGVDPAAAVPLQRDLLHAHRDPAQRRPCRAGPPLLGVGLLARDQPHRRHDRLAARLAGRARGPRRRPSPGQGIAARPRQHVAAAGDRGRRCRPRSTSSTASGSASRRSAMRTGRRRRR